MEFNHLPTNRKHQIIECVIPILERNITPGNVIEMWWISNILTDFDIETRTWHMKEESDRFCTVCEEYIRDNYEKIPLSQKMKDDCAEYPYVQGFLKLVPEENQKLMVVLNNKMKGGQGNVLGDSWCNEPPFFDYTESDLFTSFTKYYTH